MSGSQSDTGWLLAVGIYIACILHSYSICVNCAMDSLLQISNKLDLLLNAARFVNHLERAATTIEPSSNVISEFSRSTTILRPSTTIPATGGTTPIPLTSHCGSRPVIGNSAWDRAASYHNHSGGGTQSARPMFILPHTALPSSTIIPTLSISSPTSYPTITRSSPSTTFCQPFSISPVRRENKYLELIDKIDCRISTKDLPVAATVAGNLTTTITNDAALSGFFKPKVASYQTQSSSRFSSAAVAIHPSTSSSAAVVTTTASPIIVNLPVTENILSFTKTRENSCRASEKNVSKTVPPIRISLGAIKKRRKRQKSGTSRISDSASCDVIKNIKKELPPKKRWRYSH
ncbi:hypothetical protein DOLIC_00089 [Dolichomitus sp. PSUC_FEM 10030005]|nr:hypothetical protein [Dolichomitus sp. PSUC_FEM 10030005]